MVINENKGLTKTVKSIIRTRSQKLKEKQDAVNEMFSNINSFYSKYKKEPSSLSSDIRELQMGIFLKSIRENISTGQITEKAVQNQLSWFVHEPLHWKNRTFNNEDVKLMVLVFGLFPILMLGTQFYFNYCLAHKHCYETAHTLTNRMERLFLDSYASINQQISLAYKAFV
jgi:hypothetical protein